MLWLVAQIGGKRAEELPGTLRRVKITPIDEVMTLIRAADILAFAVTGSDEKGNINM